MKKTLLIFIALLPVFVFSQAKPGSHAYLNEKNGFKDIVLGSNVSPYKAKFLIIDSLTKTDEDGCTYYNMIDTSYLSIGESVKLKSVYLRTYKDQVLSIIINFTTSYNENVFDVFRKAYGTVSVKPNQFLEQYIWNSKNVSLYLDINSKAGQSLALFSCKPLLDQLQKDKSQKTKKGVSDL